jgi:hypothetical protein
MDFTSDEKIRGLAHLTDELFQHVLCDEEPIFFGDEATLLDVSAAPVEEILSRCSSYYQTAVSEDDLRRPLWEVLPKLALRGRTPSKD